ncbi:putative phage replication protein [Eggerthella sp. CAG:368]|nr:putative phage replication protein [Eggerthella sp. CAG:368]
MANTFTCFEEFADAMEDLTPEERHQIEIAICEYGFFGIETELPRLLKPTFKMMKKDIDYSVSKRSNGGKGGRPKKEKTTDIETEKPVVSENTKPNTIQDNTVQNSTKDIDSPVIAEIVDYLNEKANTSYRSSSKNTKAHIRARLKEGFTVQDFKTVIDGRIKAWAKDPRMCEYIRPDTLFGSKFESYLNAEKVGNCTSQGGDGLDEVFEEYGKIYNERAISIEELDRMAVAN